MSRRGNTVVAIGISESRNSTLAMSPHTTLSHVRFPTAPGLPGRCATRTKKTVARGSSNPGQRLHVGGDQSQQCPGDKRDRCGSHDHPRVRQLERRGVTEATV